MELIRIHRSVLAEVVVNGNTPLRFRADNIRRERTGIHATLYITLGDHDLAWTTCNVDRDEERGRLARKAFRLLTLLTPEARKAVSEEQVCRWLDHFCRHLWSAYIEEALPQPLVPEPGPPYDPLLDPPLIIDEGGTILYGPPGRGKSYTALALAVAMDSGAPMGPLRPVRPLPTLYVNLERPRVSMARRLHAVNRALELPPHRPLLMLTARGATLLDLLPIIERAVDRGDVQFVVVDSISRAGMGSLIEDTAANRIMDALNSLRIPWLAIAHTPKASLDQPFGSIMQVAAADICVQVITQRVDQHLGVGLKLAKANDIPPLPNFPIICYEFRGGMLVSLRKAQPREFPEVEKEREMSLPDLVLETILDRGPMTATQLAELLGYSRSHMHTVLSALEAQQAVASYRSGREVLYVARQSMPSLDQAHEHDPQEEEEEEEEWQP